MVVAFLRHTRTTHFFTLHRAFVSCDTAKAVDYLPKTCTAIVIVVSIDCVAWIALNLQSKICKVYFHKAARHFGSAARLDPISTRIPQTRDDHTEDHLTNNSKTLFQHRIPHHCLHRTKDIQEQHFDKNDYGHYRVKIPER